MKINGKPDGGGGREPVVTSLSVTSNGIYTPATGVDGFTPVDVDVQPALESLSVTSNGTYTPGEGIDGYSQVSVNVQPTLGTLSVSVNNTYYPGQGVDGFSQVVVDVPQQVDGYTERNITEMNYNISNLSNSASFVHFYAFTANSYLSTVNLPNASVVKVCAFSNCTNISQVNLPACTDVFNSAFHYCTNLTQISLPVCSYIGQYVFQSCSNLTQIDLPLCKTLNGNVFQLCTNLSQVSLPVCESMEATTFANTGLTSIELPMARSIGNTCFSNCIHLSQVSLSVCSNIGNSCFSGCNILQELTLNVGFYEIPPYGRNPFQGTPFVAGSGSIYVDAVNYDKFIASSGWSSLASVFVSVGDATQPLLSISDGLLSGRTTAIAISFQNYLGINKATITAVSLSKCKTVFAEAFADCVNVSQITLPECNYIGTNAFIRMWHTGGWTLTLGGSSIVTAAYNALNGNGISSIFVPASLVDSYKTAQYWSNYASMIFPIE